MIPKRAKRMRSDPHRYKTIQSGMFHTLHCLCCCTLTGRSFQDALRSFFQPIKTDDPRVDFYTMYKREATEYDADYIKKYDEDLNTTLIFVRCPPPIFSIISPVPVGRSVLRHQLRLRHRCPFQPPTQSERAVCRPPPRNPPHSQSVRHPW